MAADTSTDRVEAKMKNLAIASAKVGRFKYFLNIFLLVYSFFKMINHFCRKKLARAMAVNLATKLWRSRRMSCRFAISTKVFFSFANFNSVYLELFSDICIYMYYVEINAQVLDRPGERPKYLGDKNIQQGIGDWFWDSENNNKLNFKRFIWQDEKIRA